MADVLGSFLGGLGGGAIGSAVVRLTLDAKGYEAQLAAAKGETVTATTGMAKGFDYMKGAAVAGAAVAATAVVKFASDAIASASEHERVIAALTAQVGPNTAAFEAQATALQNVSGIQDEAILSADTILSRYKLTQQQVQSLIPTVLDYARVSGQDAASAAQTIGKALLGNTRALKAVGISYKSTGNAAEDYYNIQKLLDEKLRGQAAAYAETYTGKLEKLAAKFDDIKEAVGGELIDQLTKLADAFDTLSQIVDKVDGNGEGLSTTLDTLLVKFNPIILAVNYSTSAVAWLGKQFGITADSTDGLTQATDGLADSTGAATDKTKAWRSEQERLAQDIRKTTDAIQGQRLAQLQAAGGLAGLVASLTTAQSAEDDVNRLRREGKKGTEEFTQAARDATTAQLDFNEALRQYEQDNPTRSVVATRNVLKEMATQAGLSAREFRDAWGEALTYIDGRITNLNQRRIEPQVDTSQIDALKTKLDSLLTGGRLW